MFDFEDDDTPPEFPDVLLEPPPAWDEVGFFATHDYAFVVAEVAYRVGCEEDDLAPECRLRRYELHSVIGEHAIYLHRSGGLIQPNLMAIAVVPGDELVDEDDPDEVILMFQRLDDACATGLTADAAIAAVVAKLLIARSVADHPRD